MNPVMVATRGEDESESLEEGTSSERFEGAMCVTWPNRRPSTAPGENEKRWIMEARVGPEIAIFCRGRSSMAALLHSYS